MSIIVYVYSKCSTCQKALQFLEDRRIAFEKKEITLTPPSIQELTQMLNWVGDDIKKLFNTSGMLYRELEISRKIPEMSQQDCLNLLSSKGMLVKRPFLIGEQFGVVGFHLQKWMELL